MINSIIDCVLEDIEAGEVEIHFVSKKEIARLHGELFDDPTPTDCITLPIDPPGPDCQILGEVFVCPEVAIEYAKEHGLDAGEECTLYIVHGLLHLLGYDDIEDADRQKMRAAEKEHMDKLKKHNLILSPPPW